MTVSLHISIDEFDYEDDCSMKKLTNVNYLGNDSETILVTFI